jgi:hypothetical protein
MKLSEISSEIGLIPGDVLPFQGQLIRYGTRPQELNGLRGGKASNSHRKCFFSAVLPEKL